MAEKRNDRRSVRTTRLLREALLQLILEKGYDLLTVEDITNRADVGRTTFYLHFKDKEDLLLQSLEGVAQDLVNCISQDPDGNLSQQPVGEIILAVFEHVRRNAALYLIILKGGAAIKALDRMNSFIMDVGTMVIEQRLRRQGIASQFPVEKAAAFFAASLLGYITWWLRRGTPETPGEIASIYTNLALNGILSLATPPGAA